MIDFDFNLGDDIDLLRDTIARFAAEKIAPRAAEIDESNEFPRDLWPELGPTRAVGDYRGARIWRHEPRISGACRRRRGNQPCICFGWIVLWCTLKFMREPDHSLGHAEQKQKYLPQLINGEHVGALAMSEAGSGSDVMGMRTHAKHDGDHYVLNGSKMWITNGPEADTLLVYAVTNSATKTPGITAFLIEKGMAGYSTAQKLDKLGMRGSDTCELVFDNCPVPAGNVLGEIDQGAKILMSGLDYERVVLAGGPLGLMHACMDEVIFRIFMTESSSANLSARSS